MRPAIASNARVNALNHPLDRISQHKITYRPNEYFLFAKVDKDFREQRRGARVPRPGSAEEACPRVVRRMCRARVSQLHVQARLTAPP